MSKLETIKEGVREYGVRGMALKTADRLLGRGAEEVPYERWKQRMCPSSRDYARMAREELYYRPVIGVLSWAKGQDRLAFLESLNLQIYRNFRPMKDAPNAEYLLFAGEGCSPAPDLLWQCAKFLSENGSTGIASYSDVDLLYFDSDVIGKSGRRETPVFRPEFDPDLLERVNYMGEVFLVRASLAKQVGLPGGSPEQIHAFLKRIGAAASVPAGCERSGAVRHIPRVLYHVQEQISQIEAPGQEQLSQTDITRQKQPGQTEKDPRQSEHGTVAFAQEAAVKPLISVLIPNKDHAQDLQNCITSLLEKGGWENLEILVIENNSKEPETFQLYEALTAADARIRILSYEGAFNYSAVNNFGAGHARGDYLLLLNNDTEFLDGEALPRMQELAARQDVGAVGALLLYPDGTIQHGGILLGHGGIAGHAFVGKTPQEVAGSAQGMLMQAVHNVSAATGACLMLRREVFEQMGGLEEKLAVTFNDVDLCLRLRRAGLRVLLCPQAKLVHDESRSRGAEDSPEKVERFHNEIRLFVHRWERELEMGDPFYSPNCTLIGTSYTCRDLLREKSAPYRRYLHL